ncbi:MAG: hypothetical protein QW590_01780 [Candidatus Bilamarchaeaceae archaeon]
MKKRNTMLYNYLKILEKRIKEYMKRRAGLLEHPLNEDIVHDRTAQPRDKLSLWGVDAPSIKEIREACREIINDERMEQQHVNFRLPGEDVVSLDNFIYVGKITKKAKLRKNSSLSVEGVKIILKEIKEDGLVLDVKEGRFHSEGIRTARNTVLELGAHVIFLQVSGESVDAKVMNCSEKLSVSLESDCETRFIS